MYEWNTEFHGIGIVCEDKCVRVRNDQTLVDFLNDPQTRGSLLIAEYARALYEKKFGKPLGITQDSLAVEILGHVFVDKLAAAQGGGFILGYGEAADGGYRLRRGRH